MAIFSPVLLALQRRSSHHVKFSGEISSICFFPDITFFYFELYLENQLKNTCQTGSLEASLVPSKKSKQANNIGNKIAGKEGQMTGKVGIPGPKLLLQL